MTQTDKEKEITKNEKKNKKLIGFNKKEKIGLGILLLIIIVSPVLFTQFSSFYSFNTDTGVIGDTIGGITAPFVNLLAAYLVYKSFAAQIQANAKQRSDHTQQMTLLNKEHTFNTVNNLFNLTTEYYNKNSRIKTKPLWTKVP